MWPVSFAIVDWTAAVEERVEELVRHRRRSGRKVGGGCSRPVRPRHVSTRTTAVIVVAATGDEQHHGTQWRVP
jgi:hypothetical protein